MNRLQQVTFHGPVKKRRQTHTHNQTHTHTAQAKTMGRTVAQVGPDQADMVSKAITRLPSPNISAFQICDDCHVIQFRMHEGHFPHAALPRSIRAPSAYCFRSSVLICLLSTLFWCHHLQQILHQLAVILLLGHSQSLQLVMEIRPRLPL